MSARITTAMGADGVADVCLTRADKMNALDPAMFTALVDTLAKLRAMPGLRAVVLHGEGKAFCAGLDMAGFSTMASGQAEADLVGGAGDLRVRTHGIANAPQHVALGWRELPVPVIAAVHGVAFGGGLQIALGADLRLLAPGTRMSVMEVHWGIVPDMAGFVLTRGLVRDDHLRELVLTGRVLEASEAVSLGLGTRLSEDPLAEARSLAAGIARLSPSAVRAAKRLLNRAFDATAAEVLQAESDEQVAVMGQPNQREAVAARLDKRAPRFFED